MIDYPFRLTTGEVFFAQIPGVAFTGPPPFVFLPDRSPRGPAEMMSVEGVLGQEPPRVKKFRRVRMPWFAPESLFGYMETA